MSTFYQLVDLDALVCRLFEVGAIRIAATQSSKPPLSINLHTMESQRGPLEQDEVNAIGMLMWDYISTHDLSFGGVAGIPQAGEPFARALQDIARHFGEDARLLTLEKKIGKNGRRIGHVLQDQDLRRGSQVLLIDDRVAEAGTAIETIDELESNYLDVDDVLFFLDEEKGAKGEIESQGSTNFHAIVTLSYALNLYRERSLITAHQYEAVHNYRLATTNAYAAYDLAAY